MTTAIPTSRTPCAARYASARPLAIDAQTCRTAAASSSPPRTPRTLSASPAIETSAPSSHVALDRTASPHGDRGPTSRQSARSSSASPRGSGACWICCRASAARAYPARPARRAKERARLAPRGELADARARTPPPGRTTASGTSNPCRTSHARRAALPPTTRGSSPPRRCASASSGTSQVVAARGDAGGHAARW